MKAGSLQFKPELVKVKINFGWLFWLSVVLVHVIFFGVFYFNNNIYMADSKEYLYQAYNIKNYFSNYCADLAIQINPALYTKRPPLYGLMILMLKTIYNSNYFILFVQNLFSIRSQARPLRELPECWHAIRRQTGEDCLFVGNQSAPADSPSTGR